MKNVVSSAVEAEIGALFINKPQAIPSERAPPEMGNKQLPSQVQTDNTTALGFFIKTFNPKATKSRDMK